MSTRNTVFLIGSGLIGGEILNHLLAQDYHVTVLTRRVEAAKELEALGASTVHGTLADVQLIAEQSARHDIIIHTATADDLRSVQAVLKGIRVRMKKGLHSIYIHTSGASVLADDSHGNYSSTQIFHDDEPAAIDALDEEQPHRKIDLAIIQAAKEFDQRAQVAILMPPLVYGVGSQNGRLSIQLPTLTRFALHEGYAGHVGTGEALMSSIHVADLADGHMTLLHAMEKGEVDLRNPYFFCTNDQDISWVKFAQEIGRLMYEAGRIKSPETRSIGEDKFHLLFGPYTYSVAGMNARCRGRRLQTLGWCASRVDAITSLKEEVDMILQEKQEFAGYAAPVASGNK